MAKAIRKSFNGVKYAKGNLPTKTCAACARPFTWRKKWARNWEQVKYCSDACRGKGGKT